MMLFIPIVINSPFLYLFLLIIASFLLSFVLYNKKTGLIDVPKYLVVILFFLRFFSFLLLFLLLLKPEFKGHEKIIENPKVVFLQDNSSSIISNSDSTYYKTDYVKKIDQLRNIKNLDIDFISFDQNIDHSQISFNGDGTNISSMLKEISSIYANMHVGAYILASDGIFNEGLNPIYSDVYLNAPLHVIPLGDTLTQKDVWIHSIRHNNIAYLGNDTPLEVIIQAKEMQGRECTFEVFYHDDHLNDKSLVYQENLEIDNSNYIHSIPFLLSLEKPGLQQYYVSVKTNHIDENLTNNKKEFFIDVIDDRKKILILFSTPHPDINAIKEGLASRDEYEVYSYWVSDLNKQKINNFNEYSLIIAHQLSRHELIARLENINMPIWYIVGSNSDLNLFNQSQDLTVFENTNSSFEHANVVLNQNFLPFTISDSLSDFLSLSTPFLTPFSNIALNAVSEILLYKKIGSLNTERPVLFFVENDNKLAFLLGEGLWRWRLNDTYLNNNNSLFNHLINQITQYLLVDEDKQRFHVKFDPVQKSNERVFFEAELYNKNFELITSFDIDMAITDSLGNMYNYKFIPIDKSYYLDVSLPDGKYNFVATATFNNEIFTKKGFFVLSNFDIESKDLVANFELLSDLALTHNGRLISQDSLHQFVKSIIGSSDFKPRTYFNYYYQPFINFESLLILILFILFLEWFIRRRYINY